MNGTEADKARWPVRLRELCEELRGCSSSSDRQQLRLEVWTILSHSLQRYIESQRSLRSGLTAEDIEDLTSEKSLELIRRLESGQWVVGGRSGSEIAAFLAATARNAVIDLLRHPERRRQAPARETLPAPSNDGPGEVAHDSDAPDAPLEREEFIAALRACAEVLQPRVRRMWFFRIFYGMATKEIAAHPKIGLAPARVDAMLFEVRQAIRRCMEGKGQRLSQLPTGTFFEIWKSLHAIPIEGVAANEQTNASV